jgi:hypothetical protein
MKQRDHAHLDAAYLDELIEEIEDEACWPAWLAS